jgi:alkylation response protein AidB-like acyl-CoA dehydrogenase
MEASESFTVDFLSLPLAPDALIGKPGDYYAEPTFTAGAFRFSAVQLGGAQALFDSCRDFILTLGRENDPFQLQRIGQMAVLLESGNQWLTRAGQWLEESFTDIKHLAVHAQMVRIATEEICTRIMQLVQLCIGARGLAVSEPFASTLRDLQMYLRQAGFDHAFQTVGRYALQENAVHG